ncbi:MAG: class I SAM-dependent methyltransferase [Planctomycetes bacterium]|nr:class I SAM-dependent methyltransferase [Planctomycetota bacterium]
MEFIERGFISPKATERERSFLEAALQFWKTRPDLVALYDPSSLRGLLGYWYWLNWHGLDPALNQRADEFRALFPALPPQHLAGRVFGDESTESTFLRSGLVNCRRFFYCHDEVFGFETLTAAQPRLLDFGAGCGRIIRHLLPVSGLLRISACDVDAEAMAWMAEAMPWVDARPSPELPPLDYEAGSFDLVHAYSVFSHLPPDRCLAWVAELRRILRPGGIAIVTTQGQNVIDLTVSGAQEHCHPRPEVLAPELPRWREEGQLFFPYRKIACASAENQRFFSEWDLDVYGDLFLSPARVAADWAPFFRVLRSYEAPDAWQDFHVLEAI